jgi:hypothetical protein
MKSTVKLVGVTLIMGMILFGMQAYLPDEVRAEASQIDVLIDLFGDESLSADEVASAVDEGASGEIISAPTDQDLVFTPVEPCRIVDTRNAGPVSGVFAPNERREFYVYGTSEISSQGGNPAGCASPGGEPAAAHIALTAVPISGLCFLTAFPANVSPPLAGVLVYKAGVHPVVNAATIKTYFQVGAREIEILNGPCGSAHVVIDVMGYFYPMP